MKFIPKYANLGQQHNGIQQKDDFDNIQSFINRSELLNYKFKVINLTSENQLLKNKVQQLQQELEKIRPYQNAFKQSIRAIHSSIIQNSNEGKSPLFRSNYKGELTMLERQQLKQNCFDLYSAPLHNSDHIDVKNREDQPNSYHKLCDYELLGRLNQNQSKQTIRSFELSNCSQSIASLRPANLENGQDQLDSYTNNRENKVIQADYARQNYQYEHQSEKQSENAYELYLRNRQTAYFKHCNSPEEKQQMNDEVQILQFYDKKGCKTCKNHENVITNLKSLLAQIQSSFVQLLICLKAIKNEQYFKIVSIDEYVQSLQNKHKYQISSIRCQQQQQQIGQLKSLLRKWL